MRDRATAGHIPEILSTPPPFASKFPVMSLDQTYPENLFMHQMVAHKQNMAASDGFSC